MAEPEPTQTDIWLARGLLVAGLWFAGTGLFDLVRAMPDAWDNLIVHAPGILAGLFFLIGAWRMRAALRWDPPADD
ncbi:MAG: hypothetical protein ACRC1J_10075 [Sandaracinobacteroides sp.]